MKEYINNVLLFKGNKYQRDSGRLVWLNILALTISICALYLKIKEMQNI